ncbi:hypothetical protein P3S67_018641 [Capsicum chacoense]
MSFFSLLPLILVNIIIIFLFNLSTAADSTYNVQNYDGISDSSKAFVSAWTNPATIYVPKGSYLLGNAYFYGQTCKSNAITIRIDGTLVAPSDYNVIGKSGNWIKFERVTGVSIIGGTLGGQGTSLGKGCPKGVPLCSTSSK